MSTDATDVDHCEVAFNADDGFEFFGSTVNVKYLSALFVGDDSVATAEFAAAEHAALSSYLSLSTIVAAARSASAVTAAAFTATALAAALATTITAAFTASAIAFAIAASTVTFTTISRVCVVTLMELVLVAGAWTRRPSASCLQRLPPPPPPPPSLPPPSPPPSPSRSLPPSPPSQGPPHALVEARVVHDAAAVKMECSVAAAIAAAIATAIAATIGIAFTTISTVLCAHH